MKKIIFATLIALSSTTFATEADVYMNTFECTSGQSWSACLHLASDQAETEMNQVLNKLGACVDMKSKHNIDNPKANLDKEQAAFMKYLNSQESYLPENGAHLAQSVNEARLLLVLQRTDALKDSLSFCSEQ